MNAIMACKIALAVAAVLTATVKIYEAVEAAGA